MQEKQIWSLSQTDSFRRKWQPPPVFLPGKSIGQRRLASYSPWVAKSQTRLSMQALAPGPSVQIILRRGKTLQSHVPSLMGLTSCLHSHLWIPVLLVLIFCWPDKYTHISRCASEKNIYMCFSKTYICAYICFPRGSEVKASASNAGDPGSIPGLGRSPGEGNGNPLQYSCLENPMDWGTWWAAVHGVTKSRTRLSDFTYLLMHIMIFNL